ncbi:MULTISPECIES: DUF4160 domain-containing protein [unclassified Dehalobacter]|uniref:DUF4160 domain-containing protein n=1 Tax=unclassified Dehalobacter TaxID=2635733 RepID=UPI000E6C9524|nr:MULTISPECIES: DUF4160 domain-containing protein [unclassified Dehalobacter]RJE48907.1 hypothetical protein A7K50_09190 [Dehalobacter sp. MCB1]TCX52071.1 hypothetical protein C1I36_07075 [Dehalobacter sp. 14DCB1]TCX53144.1 hypothetical protein C1I38_08840 [Dehalobacter sp. 12DCB1]
MPIVSEFYGIKIMMFWNEHVPPHFHAEYGENKILVDIQNATVLKGIFPSKQLKLVLAWCEIHREELIVNWENGRENNQFIRIDPLK